MTTLHAFREDGTEVLPGETITMAGAITPMTFRAATKASNDAGTAGMIAVDGYPDMFSAPFGLTIRDVSGQPENHAPDEEITMTMTLKAYDAMTRREIKPGDIIRSLTAGQAFTFRAATRATEAGRDGKIRIGLPGGTGGREYFAGLFGLHVSLVDEPAWESAGTADPGDIRRDIRGPGGFQAIVGSRYWMIIDSSDGEAVTSKSASNPEDGKQAVLDWEREHGLIPETWVQHYDPQTGVPVAEPAPATPATPRDLRAILADLDSAAGAGLPPQESPDLYCELEDEVRAQLAPIRDADELTAEADRAARTTAPPVPGVTQNTGHTVYAVIRANHVPGEPSDDEWVVAAADDREHVTWKARTREDGTLAYDTGHYHTGGEGSAAEALVDLANRAGVFSRLTELCSGMVTREAFQASHQQVLTELSEVHGVGRAKVRSGLLEAAALGYARISWHAGSRRQNYGIRYDRVSCVFTWAREN